MEQAGKNPFEKGKQQEGSKNRHFNYQTFYFNLTDGDDLVNLGEQLEKVANHGYKYGIIELTSGNKVDGTPYVILRIREDKDLTLKTKNDIKVCVETYSAKDLESVDGIVNRSFSEDQSGEIVKLLAEKRFAHVILDVCIVLIWAEIKKGSKYMEAINGLRSILTARF